MLHRTLAASNVLTAVEIVDGSQVRRGMRTIRTRGVLGSGGWSARCGRRRSRRPPRSRWSPRAAAANITPTTVVLNATVNPKGAETTYFFQYGTTVIYGAPDAEHERRQGERGREDRRRGRRPGAGDDLPLPDRGAELQGPDARQGPHVQDQAPATRRHARRDTEPGPRRRRHVARRRAHGHRATPGARWCSRPTRGRTPRGSWRPPTRRSQARPASSRSRCSACP